MNYELKEIELFIREELSQHGEWLIDRFIDALERGGHVLSGDLIDSFDYGTTSTGTDGGVEMTISFPTYGRLTEIMARRRKRNRTADSNRSQAFSSRNHRPKKVEWYNRNRYAGYGRLIRRIAAGMSEQELQRIRGILNEAKQNLSK